MTPRDIVNAIMDLKIQVASMAESIVWLKWLVIGVLIPGIGSLLGTWLATWDNHKKNKALMNFLKNGGK